VTRRANPLILMDCAVLLAFGVAVAAYIVVLEPITNVFDGPIHAHPLTALGKTVMARLGPVQAVAVVTANVLLVWSLLQHGRPRQRGLHITLVPLAIVAVALGLELLMVVDWAITLWGMSQSAATEAARVTGQTLWGLPDWRAQLIIGIGLLGSATVLAVGAVVHAMRAVLSTYQTRSP